MKYYAGENLSRFEHRKSEINRGDVEDPGSNREKVMIGEVNSM